MNVLIHTKNVITNEFLRRYADRSLKFALDRFSHAVRDVHVFLADSNGPRGGVDKLCRVRVRLFPKGSVVIEDIKEDIISAIDSTAERLRRAVSRQVDRRKQVRKRSIVLK